VNFAASQEIPRIYGTRKSLTVATSARHLIEFLYDTWENDQKPAPIPRKTFLLNHRIYPHLVHAHLELKRQYL
jgi:hypothetical protein